MNDRQKELLMKIFDQHQQNIAEKIESKAEIKQWKD